MTARLERPRTVKVLVAIYLSSSSWREIFSGILAYANGRANWDMRLLPEPGNLLAPQIEEAEREGFSGIIAATAGAIDFDRLVRTPLAVAAIGGWPELSPRRTDIVRSNFHVDAVAAMGLRHLMSRGRRAVYAFARGLFDKDWPLTRQKAFLNAARAAGLPTAAYELPPGARQNDDSDALRDWLVSLPKPAAVMAERDYRAAQVIAACRDGGLRVPDDVAVLGVDDDPLFARNTRPSLSSVVIDHAGGGYRMAAELDRLMRAKDRPRPEVFVAFRPKGVVTRESTRHISAADILARRIAEYVDEHANGPLEVADVVLQLGCSRRHAEQSFRKAKGRTIGDYIADRRIDEVKRRLMRTGATVAQVSEECGFCAQAHLTRLFRRRTGLTPAAWRRHERE